MKSTAVAKTGNTTILRRRAAMAWTVLLLTVACGSGCDQIRSALQPASEEARVEDGLRESGAGTEAAIPTARQPIDLPVLELDLEPGSLVLAPRTQTRVNSIAEGFGDRTIYDFQRVIRVEGDLVYLHAPLDEEHVVRGALVLPVQQEPESEAQSGDRIIVPVGGKLAVGIVRHAARRYPSAVVRSQRMQIRYELKLGNYFLVDPDSDSGHFAFCNTGSRDETFIIIRKVDGLYVAMATHVGVVVFEESECRLLPLDPAIQVGDTVRAELLGNVREATVEQVNEADESVELVYQWRDSIRYERLTIGLVETVPTESSDEAVESDEPDPDPR